MKIYDNPYVRAWIDALRSGKFQRTTGNLCIVHETCDDERDSLGTKYCCLGVGYEVYDLMTNDQHKEWKDVWRRVGSSEYSRGRDDSGKPVYLVLHDDGHGNSGTMSDEAWRAIMGVPEGVDNYVFVHTFPSQGHFYSMNDSRGMSFAEIADEIEALIVDAPDEAVDTC